MRPLTAAAVLALCERGAKVSPGERAFALAAAAAPELSKDDLASLPIGERDALVLALREASLGPTFDGLADCPSCHEHLEFTFEIGNVRPEPPAPSKALPREPVAIDIRGVRTLCRLPNAGDALAICGVANVADARRELALRCIVHGEAPNAASVDAYADFVADALALEVASRDPQADVELAIECGACGQQNVIPFDPATFFWTELMALYRRIVHEVHRLARSYGWSERDALAMSAARRSAYLEFL